MNKPNRVAIITGGGTGIGAAGAKALAKNGTFVGVVGRRIEKLEETVKAIETAGGNAIAIQADLADHSSTEEIVSVIVEKWGQVDILVNNAAYIKHHPLEEAERSIFEEHLNVNVLAPYYLIQNALPYLRNSESAVVVNISSSSGSLAIPGQSMYGTSKAALEYLTRSLAAELAPKIRVVAIAPGPVDTPIHLSWAGDDIEGAYERMEKEVPLARMGTAAELGRCIAWLTSSEADWITGVVLPVDGGQVLPGALSVIAKPE
jgi:NAD(P)-dependent dehydrogenase (short-subunit alcohol dehydrogenase family)